MKKIIISIIIMLIPFISFSQTSTLEECNQALSKSNALLERTLDRIQELEEENKELRQELENGSNSSESELIESLKDDNQRLRISLAKASNSLKDSNEVLEKAYERISKDQEEIEKLRNRIEELIDAGVEVKTYNWGISVLAGYPYEIGFDFNYNLHWMPNIGIVVGSSYDVENDMPKIKAGIRINIGQ